MKTYLTSPEAAKILGVSHSTIRSWKFRGQGPPYLQMAGKNSQVFYDPDVIEMYRNMRRKVNEQETKGSE